MKYVQDIHDLDLRKTYSYADYLRWRFKERVELIAGRIFRMSPAPTSLHQKVSFNITKTLIHRVGNTSCNIYYAPFDVRIPTSENGQEKDIFTVVQPDIVIICDPLKIDEKGCLGAPDIIFEILSKSTLKKDLHEKYELYEESGVKEYWIIDPLANTFQINKLNNEGKYIPGRLLTKEDIAKSEYLPGLYIEIDAVFPPSMVEEPVEEYRRL